MKTTATAQTELTHAGHCLNVYLNNTAEIYNHYTVPAYRYAAGLLAFGAEQVNEWLLSGAKVNGVDVIGGAIDSACEMVERYDHLTPNPADIAEVTRRYCLCVIEEAQYINAQQKAQRAAVELIEF